MHDYPTDRLREASELLLRKYDEDYSLSLESVEHMLKSEIVPNELASSTSFIDIAPYFISSAYLLRKNNKSRISWRRIGRVFNDIVARANAIGGTENAGRYILFVLQRALHIEASQQNLLSIFVNQMQQIEALVVAVDSGSGTKIRGLNKSLAGDPDVPRPPDPDEVPPGF